MNRTNSIIKVIINILYFLSTILLGFYFLYKLGFVKWLDYEELDFFKNLISSTILYAIFYYISYFISIIWHEFGHYVFGKKIKLEFISFSVLNYTFFKENNGITLKKYPIVPGAKGYCNMLFDENKSYTKKQVVLYFLGGIIFNLIFSIVFFILFLLNKNIYFKVICLFFVVDNIYFAVYNSILSTLKTGLNTDMMQINNYLNDPEFTKICGRLQKVQALVLSGIKIEDLDKNMLYMPDKFNTHNEVSMAQFYIDYISAKQDYNEALKALNFVEKNAKNILNESELCILKCQKINCIFYGNYDLNMINDIWDKNLEKFLISMENTSLELLVIRYLYYKLIDKDDKKSQYILNKFDKVKMYIRDKNSIANSEKFIDDIDKRNN